MKDVEVTCVTGLIQIPDLGLRLEKGEVVLISAARAESSIDLQLALRARGVTARQVQGSREVRKAPLAIVPKPQKAQKRTVPFPSPTPEPVVVEAVVDMAEVRQVVREEVTGAVREAILQGVLPQGYSMGVAEVTQEPEKKTKKGRPKKESPGD